MNFSDANKKQLYQISTDPKNDLPIRYEAARVLQGRTFRPSTMMLELVRCYPKYTLMELAERFGVHPNTIDQMARKFGLKRAVEG
jgi:hypothetical protein